MGSNLWGDVLDMSEQEDDAVPDVSEQEDDAVPDVSRQVDADEGLMAIEHVDPEALDALVARASAVAADDGPAAEGERLPEPTTHRVDADEGLMGSADITGREPVVRAATPAARDAQDVDRLRGDVLDMSEQEDDAVPDVSRQVDADE